MFLIQHLLVQQIFSPKNKTKQKSSTEFLARQKDTEEQGKGKALQVEGISNTSQMRMLLCSNFAKVVGLNHSLVSRWKFKESLQHLNLIPRTGHQCTSVLTGTQIPLKNKFYMPLLFLTGLKVRQGGHSSTCNSTLLIHS